MKTKKYLPVVAAVIAACFLAAGCGQKKEGESSVQKPAPLSVKTATSIKTVSVLPDDPLYYLSVVGAEASSFDQTPDWAPEPDPMAPVDGDMLTRWSSNYEGSSEWISFDLGVRSVVSDVIIRWERAYAAKYKILVSDNGENWQEVYSEENGRGGVMEAVFPAVECRYVKILGTEKVEDKWGISIWEVEIYGPRSFNPGSAVSKEEYLSKEKDEEMKKEAENLMEEMASPVVSLSEAPFQSGVVYTSWMSDELSTVASDITLIRLKKLGFNTVSIMVPAYQDELQSDAVFTNDEPGGDTPSEESIEHAIGVCHKLGLRVMVKVHIDPRTDEARVDIIPSAKWFDSYEALVLRYAVLAENNGAELFSVGTELEGTTFGDWNERWRDIIKKVRAVFNGALTYSANWTEYTGVTFWDELDFIGIDAYFPLSGKDNPSLDELTAAWNERADEVEKWLGEAGLTGKGVLLTEIGYTSTVGTNRQPWAAISNVADQKEQADCFAATFGVLSLRPWFRGYYIWQYMPQERWSPLGFTINGKRAEKVVEEWNKKLNKASMAEEGGLK